jgi:hypothetical protein
MGGYLIDLFGCETDSHIGLSGSMSCDKKKKKEKGKLERKLQK